MHRIALTNRVYHSTLLIEAILDIIESIRVYTIISYKGI